MDNEKVMDLKIEKEKNVAYIKLSGPISREAFFAAFDLTVSDKRYKHGMGRLWDFREANLSSLDSKTITDLAEYSSKFPPGINDAKVAFVAVTNLEYGLSRMFELSSQAITPIRVFRAMEEAEKWIME